MTHNDFGPADEVCETCKGTKTISVPVDTKNRQERDYVIDCPECANCGQSDTECDGYNCTKRAAEDAGRTPQDSSERDAPNDYHDAYRGARDDLLEWKQRALKAEANADNLARELAASVNGRTLMGEPVLSAPQPERAVKRYEWVRSGMSPLDKSAAPRNRNEDFVLASAFDAQARLVDALRAENARLIGRAVPLTEWQQLEAERESLRSQLSDAQRGMSEDLREALLYLRTELRDTHGNFQWDEDRNRWITAIDAAISASEGGK